MDDDSYSQGTEKAAATRRGFLKIAVGVMTFLNGIVLGIPIVNTLVSSAAKRKQDWSKVAEVRSLPEGRPVEVKFEARTEDAYHYANVLYSVWVVKHPGDRVTVLSPICTHLGCHFLWSSERERFECPCHASVFASDGKVLYGPAPRPLDTLPAKIENGVLLVQWQRYKTGTPEKIAV
jgi:menaquinol-cytochrome c reductase iron-sulfur subunit